MLPESASPNQMRPGAMARPEGETGVFTLRLTLPAPDGSTSTMAVPPPVLKSPLQET